MATRPSYAVISQHASFEHERLKLSDKSIRLFQVQRGSKNETLSLRMTQFSAQRRPSYKAISYTWGSSNNPKDILINGKIFSLHMNLWNMLYHLRLKGETSFLWADALCINQLNLKERSFHVRLMGRIYEQATSVIVWLGLPAPDRTEARALEFLQEMSNFRKTQSDTVFLRTYLVPALQHRWENLFKMCCHDYWTRTWIIQEFIFASALEVVTGAVSIDWKCFEDLMDLLRSREISALNKIVMAILQSRTARLTLRRQVIGLSNLYDLVREYSDSKCTERRDKIYGILGLASDCAEDPDTGRIVGVYPDYEKHIVEVYLDAVRCIEKSLLRTEQLPIVVLLVLRTLDIQKDDIAEYVRLQLVKQPPTLPLQAVMLFRPDYVSPIVKVWPSWTSTGDLEQKLENYDWGEHIGYEIQQVPSRQRTTPTLRRASSRTVHSALPSNFVANALDAASTCPSLPYLHNIPSSNGPVLSPEYVMSHEHDKRLHDNTDFRRPTAILEQRTGSDALRVGYACTNARRGDFVVQFRGIYAAWIVERIGYTYSLKGKAIMITHSGLQYEHGLDPVCLQENLLSHCPGSNNDADDPVMFQSDPLSLAELLTISC